VHPTLSLVATYQTYTSKPYA